MEFIGSANGAPAPQLKDAQLSSKRLRKCYLQCVAAVYQMWNVCKLVHCDLSEYNILYRKGSCCVIDVAQAVDKSHPSAERYLGRDCSSLTTFFNNRGVANVLPVEEFVEFVIQGKESADVGEETHDDLVNRVKQFVALRARKE